VVKRIGGSLDADFLFGTLSLFVFALLSNFNFSTSNPKFCTARLLADTRIRMLRKRYSQDVG
jgi:hypothetical protein